MRVLQLLAGTGFGGAERMGCTIHELACRYGCQSRIDAPPLPDVVAGVLTASAITLQHEAGERGLYGWAQAARERRRVFRPDVVHVHLATPRLISAAWWIAGRTPLALTFQLLPAAARWPNDALLRVPSAWVLAHLARRRRCTFIAVAEADQRSLRRRFPHAEVALTTNLPAPPPRAAGPAQQLSYPAGCLRLLSVGRLVEQKGFDLMLEQLAQPALRTLAWHWIIVGEGAARADLARRCRTLGLQARVSFLGATPSHGLYEQADLVLCPSRHEAAPLVPREAILAGVPVVLSDIAPHRELVGATARVLPERCDAWGPLLKALFTEPATRDALRVEQAPARVDRSAELWYACSNVYTQLLQPRRHA
ncbi:MAG: glycosyltransferase family 4 protein [Polyangiales bacterium]